ncbi:TonB-dependent receptor [Tamlana sp. 2201CG12-4]|uniref:TonB-dependent receptor domain-containing protein n=1 Tax=Tamlana sp. 2201CG12-4 TaxID=3112582 RepID=UPI002DB68E82|nr:TonB-dependent receptor [Tamlana sp. 2201CG12-4]MEC3907539.1 TonB-dependent receptor [Tamlana sp. 2201CG12-4]
MKRIDMDFGGPISENLNYNIGGFYRDDKGIYGYDYSVNKGGQIKGNLVKHFEKGFLKVYGKFINDRVNWNLPSPYIFNKDGSLGEIPGFDLKTGGNAIAKDDVNYSYTLPGGQTINRDLKDGFYTELASFGLEFKYDLGNNWRLNNKFRIDVITHNSDFDLSTDVSELDPSRSYYYTDGSAVDNVANLNGNGLSQGIFLSANDNEYDNLINRLEFVKKSERNALTIGFEYFKFKLKTFSSSALSSKEVTQSPRILVADNPGSGITSLALFDPTGVSDAYGDEDTFSMYLSDEIKVSDEFRIDLGFRFDNKSLKGARAIKEGGSVITGGNGYTLGAFDPFDDKGSNWAASVGFNYKLNKTTALFARGSRGYSGIKLGDYTNDGVDIDALKEVEDRLIYQGEIGLKYGASSFALFTSLLYASVDNASSQIFIPAVSGGLIPQNVFFSTRTISAEIEAQYKLSDNWLLKLISTYQDAEYTDFNFVANPGTIVEGQAFDWSGNVAERAPKITGDLTVSYNSKKFNAFMSYRYYGSRWSTPANNVKIKEFGEVYCGAGYNLSKKLSANINIANLFNKVALTAGNTRGDQFADIDASDGKPRIGRRNFPFSLFTSLKYNFGK